MSVRRELAWEMTRIWLRQNGVFALLLLLAPIVAILWQDNREQAGIILGGTIILGGSVAGLKVVHRMVGEERNSGLYLLWLQKPGTLLRVYLLRYAWSLLLLCALLLIVAPLVAYALVQIAGSSTDAALRVGFSIFGWALIPAATCFALSSWGVEDDAIYAFVLLVALFSIGVRFGFNDSLSATIIRSLLSPSDAFAELVDAATQPFSQRTAVLILAGHFIGWTGIGIAGLRVAGRK